MEMFTEQLGSLLLFVNQSFDRVMLNGYRWLQCREYKDLLKGYSSTVSSS